MEEGGMEVVGRDMEKKGVEEGNGREGTRRKGVEVSDEGEFVEGGNVGGRGMYIGLGKCACIQ